MMKINSLKSLTWNALKLNEVILEDKIVLNGSGKAMESAEATWRAMSAARYGSSAPSSLMISDRG